MKIKQQEEAEYRQANSGRPSPKTQYVKKTRDRYDLTWELNQEALSQAEPTAGLRLPDRLPAPETGSRHKVLAVIALTQVIVEFGSTRSR